ncbi:MAG: phage holin family protein [Halanaerobiales bacterium]|nr:phage holin family protein [Halanaerobiales bacterium]
MEKVNAKWRPFTDEIIYYWNKFFDHTAIKGFLAAGGTILNMIFGNMNAAMQGFLVLLAADYITGLIKASKKGKLSSWMSRKGWGKLATYSIVISLGHLITQIGMTGMRNFVLLWAGATEAISVLENFDDLGIVIPAFMREKLLNTKKNKFGEEIDK